MLLILYVVYRQKNDGITSFIFLSLLKNTMKTRRLGFITNTQTFMVEYPYVDFSFYVLPIFPWIFLYMKHIKCLRILGLSLMEQTTTDFFQVFKICISDVMLDVSCYLFPFTHSGVLNSVHIHQPWLCSLGWNNEKVQIYPWQIRVRIFNSRTRTLICFQTIWNGSNNILYSFTESGHSELYNRCLHAGNNLLEVVF